MKTEILIVGQGLAGSLLAWELSRRGCQALVVDDDRRGSSSMAAAGLITPVTGKRLALQENADALLRSAENLYTALEQSFGRQFFYPMPVMRLFINEEQRLAFVKRQQDSSYDGFVGSMVSNRELAGIIAPQGGGWLRRTGYVDTRALLDAISNWLRQENRLISAKWTANEMRRMNGQFYWRQIEAKRLVFCEGYRAIQNQRFDHLPWSGAKGEILELRLTHSANLPEAIINWGNWLSPRGGNRYRLGATHQWSPLDNKPTDDARTSLLEDLERRIPDVQYEVTDHAVGVRPATRNRRPFLGQNPTEPGIHIFNGFGSKGGLLIPWHARLMARHLLDGTPLPGKLDIAGHV